MPLTPREVRVLETFVGTIEHSLTQAQAYNGLAAIRDAALTMATISATTAGILNIDISNTMGLNPLRATAACLERAGATQVPF